jgi:glycosyltransferase involved in cell wall biosynthesis
MISVIIPCYNCEKFVSRAIDSVFAQSFTNWELILVNNNSEDNTQAVLDKYAAQFPDKIRVFTELKKGGCAARNKGLSEAKGEWIQFLDADDEILPEKLTRQLSLISDSDCDIVSGSFILEKNNGGTISKSEIFPESKNVWKGLISSRLGITSSNLWKRDKVNSVSGWDEELTSSQEYDLLFRLLKNAGKVCFDKIPSAIIHSSAASSVSKSREKDRLEKILENLVTLRLKIRAHLENQGLFDPALSSYYNEFLYNHLMNRKQLAPEYVDRRIQELGLRVPFLFWIKLNIKYYGRKVGLIKS